MTDYLKLAREARALLMREERRWLVKWPFDIPALCDAIEAQAAEIAKLRQAIGEMLDPAPHEDPGPDWDERNG